MKAPRGDKTGGGKRVEWHGRPVEEWGTRDGVPHEGCTEVLWNGNRDQEFDELMVATMWRWRG